MAKEIDRRIIGDLLENGIDFVTSVPCKQLAGVIEVLEGLSEGDVLGIPMVSRLKEEHDRMDERIRRSRSFGAGRGDARRPAGGR